MENEIVKKGKLVIVRHQESEWNKLGQWTGSRDVHLTEDGFAKSKELGELVKDICFDKAFASMQVRSIETLSSILSVCMADSVLPTEHVSALNERDYGDYTGKNKWDMETEIGEDEFNKIRRGWDVPVPNGESLKMVYERAVPFFVEVIVPLINSGKNILIVSHGNTIRALMKYIEKIKDEDISNVEMLFSDIVIYDLDNEGYMINKEIRSLKNQ
ncbi:MAG: 2,3-bisphosphoglycerate-dependent phosphoglycerate mutase [Parcubacteria bacterium C7867-006]|nr:MAG: 2,3-bisphosphoglycerate-dependent phosphoglycerate mutase [Parcubacteria bacterium C7867-006]